MRAGITVVNPDPRLPLYQQGYYIHRLVSTAGALVVVTVCQCLRGMTNPEAISQWGGTAIAFAVSHQMHPRAQLHHRHKYILKFAPKSATIAIQK